MKIKLDYVTNSSSTSVVLLGVGVDPSNMGDGLLKKLFDTFLENASEEDKEQYKTIEEYSKDNGYELMELLQKVAGDVGLSYKRGPDGDYGDYGWIGKSPFDIGDNETGLQFKTRIVCSLNKLGIPITIRGLQKIEESWRDG